MTILCNLWFTSNMDKTFQQIVVELREAGYADMQIAHLCNCTRQHIWKLGNSQIKEPGFRIGKRLTKLHEALQ